MKPLIVGESNPYQGNAEDANSFAMYPLPRGASGDRLCTFVMGLDAKTYLRMFDRTDLCHPKWSIRAARVKAAQLAVDRTESDVIVLCGRKVAAAFGLNADPFSVVTNHVRPVLVVLPHPSGLCRIWHEPRAVERAREALRQVGVL